MKKSIPQRLIAVLLSLFMVLVLLPVPASAVEGDTPIYTAVAEPTSGKNYIIAYTEGATAHAIDNDGMPTTAPEEANVVGYIDLTVSSSQVTTDDESLVWKVTSNSDGSGWLIKPAYGSNTGKYLYPGTSKSILYLNTKRAWTYSNSNLNYSTYSQYLNFSGDGFQYADTDSPSAITFYEEVIEVTGISLSATASTVAQKDTLTLAATLTPSGATSTVTWASSDESVATVSGGVVTGLSAGSADITATTANGKTATCTVTVSTLTSLWTLLRAARST
jgi:uncharacterized protein YjdB